MKDNYTPTLFPQSESIESQDNRYSLPEMLLELKNERTTSYFSKEILDQLEISKIFEGKRIARAKGKK